MASVAYQMGRLPAELLDMDDDGSWLATLIQVHNDIHSKSNQVHVR